MKYFPASVSRLSQRAASTRKKCPLEKISTLSLISRTRVTTRSARGYVGRRFSVETPVAKQLPIRSLRPNIHGAKSFVVTVVPFNQVRIDFGYGSEAR
jgi:hypothetical protein